MINTKKAILIADSNKERKELLFNAFKDDYIVLFAEDGIIATDYLEKFNACISVALLEVDLPKKSGFSILEEIQKFPQIKIVPVIMIVSAQDKNSQAKAIDLGAADIILEPYHIKIMKQRVSNIVRKSILEQALAENILLKENEHSLEINALYDKITGIYNKETFYIKTKELILLNPNIDFTILCINIERFKIINDIFGAEEGDKLLHYIGTDLKEKISGKTSTYGRISGEIFAICIPTSKENIKRISQYIEKFLKEYPLNFEIVSVMGIYNMVNKCTPVSIMCDRAKMALNQVKGNYIKRYSVYDDNLRKALIEEQEIINEMNSALSTGQFQMYLQPVYSLSAGVPISAEALARWIHPTKGIISTEKFISVFEKNGFIMKLDRYIWKCACIQMRKWEDENKPVIPIAVNASRINMYNPNFCSDIINLVKEYNINPKNFKIEITESAYLNNSVQLQEAIKTLQNQGFSILMDDFGSGYSSLNMLKDIPVDALKIDLKFMKNLSIEDRAGFILTSVVHMANWLKLPVIVEGVETKEQLEYLCSIGCDIVQGYFFSKPLPVSDFEKLIDNPIEFRGFNITEQTKDIQEKYLVGYRKMLSSLYSSIYGINLSEEYKEEKNRILAEILTEITFDYDVIKDKIHLSIKLSSTERQESTIENYVSYINKSNRLDSNSKRVIQNVCSRAIKNPSLDTFEFRADINNKGPRWYKGYYSGIKDEQGNVYRIVGRADDIEAEKETEKLLQQEEAYREAFLGDMFFVCEYCLFSGKINILHKTAHADILFYSPSDYLGIKEQTFIFKNDQNRVGKEFSKSYLVDAYYNGMRELKDQYKVKNKKGEWIWIETTVHLIKTNIDDELRALIYFKEINDAKKKEKELKTKAEQDSLSGLYNRRTVEFKINEYLETRKTDKTYTFIILDIDNFKTINDTYGHQTGDRVIAKIGATLKKDFKEEAVLGRMGGDEFVLFLMNIFNKEKIELLLKKINEISLEFGTVPISVSAGVSFAPENGNSFNELYSTADKALYKAKSNGKNTFTLF